MRNKDLKRRARVYPLPYSASHKGLPYEFIGIFDLLYLGGGSVAIFVLLLLSMMLPLPFLPLAPLPKYDHNLIMTQSLRGEARKSDQW